ncbi:MAG TPA: hypothetical protein VE987_01040 [Polyangiaceae bacterium]|nr:hypothetical protein [Polyangiaceae bacterium]
MRTGASVAVLSIVATLLACSEGATSDPGLTALLRVQGAQFVAGAMPPASSAGPKVDSIAFATNTIWAGEAGKSFSGALDSTATAVAVALSGDRGYWLQTAGVPDFSAPTSPTFHGLASFATTLAPGQYALQVRAVDASGNFGPPATQVLTASAAAPSAPPAQGQLVVTLSWDTESDLDLHVVDPLGNEIFHGAPSSAAPASGASKSLADAGSPGYLDFDSNAGCVIDGLRREDVIWPGPPPEGTYLVRVDTPSLCGQPIANFTVQAVLEGALVGQAAGVALDSDTWGPHDRAAGRLVLTLTVP